MYSSLKFSKFNVNPMSASQLLYRGRQLGGRGGEEADNEGGGKAKTNVSQNEFL